MEDRAQKIVETAIALAEEGGYPNVRLRDVAAQANVALGTLYKRFSSKEDILVAALEMQCSQLEEVLRESPPEGDTSAARLSFFFMLGSHALFQRPNYAKAVLRAVSSGVEGIAAKVMNYQETMTRMIVRTIREGGWNQDAIEPTEIEGDVSFMLQKIWYADLIGWVGDVRTEDEVITNIGRACELLLPALDAEEN